MKVVILAGGRGTRLAEETHIRPKPMVEIGGKPILWHIMKSYYHSGFNEFALALGYKGEYIKRYFLDYSTLNSNLTVEIPSGKVTSTNLLSEEWKVHLWDTGLDTQTGGRVARLKELIGNETFLMTYGDGVCDVDIEKVVKFHKKHGKKATLTAVRPPARYGSLEFAGNSVSKFSEKDPVSESFVNGGFFVLEPSVLDIVEDDNTEWEKGVLAKLADQGELMAFRHEGYWQSMDTLRDKELLNNLWNKGKAPWKIWE